MARKSQEITPSLEQNLDALKQVVGRMEEKNLPLEESLALFEEGIGRVRIIQKMLNDAEQKIMVLLKQKNGESELEPFKE